MNTFTYNNISTSQFGILIKSKKIYQFPERDQEFIDVPGRDGSIIYDNGNYKNIDISFEINLSNVADRAEAIKAWLCQPGYNRLESSYFFTQLNGVTYQYHRFAAIDNKISIDEFFQNFGIAEISFNCKPYLYLNSGESRIALNTSTTSKTVLNPTNFTSEPVFEITCSGNVELNINSTNYSFTFPAISSTYVIDSRLSAVYRKSDNVLMNNCINNFTEFPMLASGSNSIKKNSGSVSAFSVVPNWRML